MLYYCKTRNFGDDLNPWLWSRLAPELLEERDDRLFLAIGTILSPGIPKKPEKFVFGSGWSGEKAPSVDRNWKIFGVRGPLTARGLGLKATAAFSDPALLVRRCLDRPPTSDDAIGFMPHHRSVRMVDWESLCSEHGLRFINPENSVEVVLNRLAQCRIILAEAMHGAIIADALRIPWVPVSSYSHINEFKWRDWCESIGEDFVPLRTKPVTTNRPKGSRRVSHLLKWSLAGTPLGKKKWKRLPIRKSRPAEIRSIMDSLHARASASDGFLSKSSRTEEAESRQLEALDKLRTDWN